MNLLLSAYAVSPNRGSEPGVGWNWTIELAKFCNVHVITEAEFKTEIEDELQKLSQRDNIHFYFNDIGEKARKICWKQGDYRFYHYYKDWQKKTYTIALNIIANNKIDIIQQLNMIGYREPGYLWKINNIPYIWGPIGGYVFIESAFLPTLGLKGAIFYSAKNIANYLQARFLRRVRKAINRADLLLAASNETKSAIFRFYNKEAVLLNETGCHNAREIQYPTFDTENKSFDILWVGRIIPTKMLNIALETISLIKELPGINFHIVGSALNEKTNNYWKDHAKSLGISNICTWHGSIPHHEVQKIMRQSDLLFFTSIVEGTSHVVLESLSNGLPIVCFDTCGHGQIVTSDVGIKIKLKNPQSSIHDFSTAIRTIHGDRKLAKKLSEGAFNRAKEITWENKAQILLNHYEYLIGEKISR